MPSRSEVPATLPPDTASSSIAAGPRVSPVVLEALPLDLEVMHFDWDEDGLGQLSKAAASGGLYATLRRGGVATGGSSCWWAAVDAALYPTPEGVDAHEVTALRVRRRPGDRTQPPEVLACLCRQIADSALKPWPLASGEEELLLIDRALFAQAALALVRAGNAIGPPASIAPPPELQEDGLATSDVERFCGVWRLVSRFKPSGAVTEKYSKGEGPLRIQAPSGIYTEFGVSASGEVHGQTSCCGILSVEEQDDDNKTVAFRQATVGFEPPAGGALKSIVVFEPGGGDDGEDVALETVSGVVSGSQVERWERIGTGEVTVLELEGTDPIPGDGRCHIGFWLFCSSFWVRAIGPWRRPCRGRLLQVTFAGPRAFWRGRCQHGAPHAF